MPTVSRPFAFSLPNPVTTSTMSGRTWSEQGKEIKGKKREKDLD